MSINNFLTKDIGNYFNQETIDGKCPPIVKDKLNEITYNKKVSSIVELAIELLSNSASETKFNNDLLDISKTKDGIYYLLLGSKSNPVAFNFIVNSLISLKKQERTAILISLLYQSNFLGSCIQFIPAYLYRIELISGEQLPKDIFFKKYGNIQEFKNKYEYYFD